MHPFQLIYFKMQPNLPTNRGNTCSTSQRSSGLPSPCSSSSRVVSDCWATWPGHIPSAIIEICVLNDKCNSIQFQKIGLMDWFTWFNSNERLNLGNIYIYIHRFMIYPFQNQIGLAILEGFSPVSIAPGSGGQRLAMARTAARDTWLLALKKCHVSISFQNIRPPIFQVWMIVQKSEQNCLPLKWDDSLSNKLLRHPCPLLPQPRPSCLRSSGRSSMAGSINSS